MKPRSRQKHKGRTEAGNFIAVPNVVVDSPNWKRCGGTTIKLVCALVRQFNGHNNGDLCAAESVLERFGITHGGTIGRAIREARHYGIVLLTRQGGLNRPSLYALSWHAIDECNGKLEVPATRTPPGDWKEIREPFVPAARKRNATTQTAAPRDGIRSSRVSPAPASVRNS